MTHLRRIVFIRYIVCIRYIHIPLERAYPDAWGVGATHIRGILLTIQLLAVV